MKLSSHKDGSKHLSCSCGCFLYISCQCWKLLVVVSSPPQLTGVEVKGPYLQVFDNAFSLFSVMGLEEKILKFGKISFPCPDNLFIFIPLITYFPILLSLQLQYIGWHILLVAKEVLLSGKRNHIEGNTCRHDMAASLHGTFLNKKHLLSMAHHALEVRTQAAPSWPEDRSAPCVYFYLLLLNRDPDSLSSHCPIQDNVLPNHSHRLPLRKQLLICSKAEFHFHTFYRPTSVAVLSRFALTVPIQ